MAYAWDTDPAAYLGHGATMSEGVAVNTPVPADDEHTDDHCCHGEAHLLVLLDDASAEHSFFIARAPLSGLQSSLRLRYVAPLLRPPIV